MKTFRLLYSTLIGMGVCAAVSSSAQAGDVLYHGNFCTPVLSDINKIEHGSPYGVHNVSSSTAQVQCPFNNNFSGTYSVNDVWVTVYDRNSSTNVSCTLYGVALDGNIIWQTSGSSSGSSAPAQFIRLHPPQGGLLGTMNMRCSIPGVTSSGFSHVTTYRLITP
jgi:hypothetical protein